jgi:hypothetical protein
VEEYLKNLLQENSGLFLKEMQQKLNEDLSFDKSISTIQKILTEMDSRESNQNSFLQNN